MSHRLTATMTIDATGIHPHDSRVPLSVSREEVKEPTASMMEAKESSPSADRALPLKNHGLYWDIRLRSSPDTLVTWRFWYPARKARSSWGCCSPWRKSAPSG